MTATIGATVVGSGRCAVMSADPLLDPVEGVAVEEAETGEMVLAVVGVLLASVSAVGVWRSDWMNDTGEYAD